MSPYPIGYEADFIEERSRLTTFFRLVMAIPLFLVGMVYGIGLCFSVIGAWFALVFTGRYPEGLYKFNAGCIRYFTRVQAYTRYVTDAYPPFDLDEHPEYPVRIGIAAPQESYDRVKVFFRLFLAIPVAIFNYALSLLANISAFLSWFVILFTGKQNASLQNAIDLGTGYGARAGGYFFMLTDAWPPFSVEPPA
jgi:hypothetical protein